ncbi:type VI secretion system tube protein Hcp [Vibrio sp. ZSDE26]|uniref:Type VI secretion system tube protein Hcp n=1 Tax=Vibrio amylolyticus TaxID=2847292 RepID=A0A9X1XKF6_9VIBR|nr:type VI secretion system tube protein TssD [Vibrio amylolyticus]MCK6263790.1 type VI secretion system tube protein Hcp [Vibrio amylolyticus]
MTTIAYMTIESMNNGCLSTSCNTASSMGNGFQDNHENEITVLGFSHNLAWESRSIHSPVQIVKKIDKSSPLLAQSCADGEEMKCKISFYRNAPTGGFQEKFYEIELLGALIRNVHVEMPNIVHLGESEMQEIVDISYRDIQWKHLAATTNGYSSWLNGLDGLKDSLLGN